MTSMLNRGKKIISNVPQKICFTIVTTTTFYIKANVKKTVSKVREDRNIKKGMGEANINHVK